MKYDLKKVIGDMLGKIDNKVLETKLHQAIELIKKGDHDEIIKKFNNADKEELLAKLHEMEKLNPQELDVLREKIGSAIKKDELNSISNNLNTDGKKILEKIISTFKIK